METEFIPYELALELKELGFDESCLGWFKNNELTTSFNDLYINPKERGKRFEIIKAPIYQQAFRWLRDNIELYTCIELKSINEGYCFKFLDRYSGRFHSRNYFSYEEAQLECLKKMIRTKKSYYSKLKSK